MPVTGNAIQEIEKRTFDGLDQLRVLDLDRNSIYKIDARAFAAVPELRCLRLAGNNIRVIYEDTFLSVPNLQVNSGMCRDNSWKYSPPRLPPSPIISGVQVSASFQIISCISYQL